MRSFGVSTRLLFVTLTLSFVTFSKMARAEATMSSGSPAKSCALSRWTENTMPGDPLEKLKAINELQPSADQVSKIIKGLEEYLKNPTYTSSHDLAMTWAWLADALATEYENVWNNSGKADAQQEIVAVDRAFELEPNLGFAFYPRGFTLREFGFHAEALASFETAASLDPSCAAPVFQAGNELVNLGRFLEAVKMLQKALDLDPSPAFAGKAYWILGKAHFFSQDYPKAILWLQKSVNARPNSWFNRLYLVAALSLNGEKAQAAKVLADFNAVFPNYTIEKVMANEEVNPVSNSAVLAGRSTFYGALGAMGMPAK